MPKAVRIIIATATAHRTRTRTRTRTRHDRECQGIIAAIMSCNVGLRRCVERRDKIAELIDKSGERPT